MSMVGHSGFSSRVVQNVYVGLSLMDSGNMAEATDMKLKATLREWGSLDAGS